MLFASMVCLCSMVAFRNSNRCQVENLDNTCPRRFIPLESSALVTIVDSYFRTVFFFVCVQLAALLVIRAVVFLFTLFRSFADSVLLCGIFCM